MRENPEILPTPARGLVEMRAVHFAYPTRLDSPVFNGFDLCVNPGEKIALVGHRVQAKLPCFNCCNVFMIHWQVKFCWMVLI